MPPIQSQSFLFTHDYSSLKDEYNIHGKTYPTYDNVDNGDNGDNLHGTISQTYYDRDGLDETLSTTSDENEKLDIVKHFSQTNTLGLPISEKYNAVSTLQTLPHSLGEGEKNSFLSPITLQQVQPLETISHQTHLDPPTVAPTIEDQGFMSSEYVEKKVEF